MPDIVSDTFAGGPLPASNGTPLYTIPAATKGHIRIDLVNTDGDESHIFTFYVKRFSGGTIVYLSGIDEELMPHEGAVLPPTAPTQKFSAQDEIHGWGDAEIHYLISGGLEV